MRVLQGGAVLAALLLSAACGSSGGGAAAPSPSSTARGFAAYAACLRQHGVNVPTAFPTARPSGRPRFFGGANAGARRACQPLAPQRRRQGLQELQAYRSCLADHGVTLPSPSRSPGVRRSPGAGRFGRLDTADPKVAKAVKICHPLLPTFSPRPSPS
jgi:hypothetical protein